MQVRITVKFLAHLADATGKKELIVVTENNFYKAIEKIEKEIDFPIRDKLNDGIGLLINGKSHHLYLKKNFQLAENDILVFVPILGGG
ncbi:MAG: hypothetical protein VR72_09945 [Clostridiaceae bacterium BRH_c20a]|nr:MAG: hypothetical protein VR72_09945 [Clostridiaceae bacterium BRH_c20a]